MVVRKTAWLIIALLAPTVPLSAASAQQWDPESGDTWEAPPPQEQPAQPPAQQPPAQYEQQPRPQYQPAPTSRPLDAERPPEMGGDEATDESDESRGGSDHARIAVGGIGVGWFGMQRIAYYNEPDPSRPNDIGGLDVATIGARIWLSELIGIDAAIGFGFSSAGINTDTPTGDTSNDQPGAFGFLLHAGMPLAIYHNQHYKFLIIPELDLGYAAGDLGEDAELTELSGLTFQVGARIGTEIHFGFIDVPELAVQASVGLALQYQTATSDRCPDGPTCANNTVETRSSLTLNTLEFDEPWDILTGNVAAIYYFR